MSQASILSFFSSNLAEKGTQKRKSLDFTEGPSATKSLKYLGPSEINVSASEALFVFFFFFVFIFGTMLVDLHIKASKIAEAPL